MTAIAAHSGVELVAIDSSNWRSVCALEVQPDQADFVAPVSYYLALCNYGDDWSPAAIVDTNLRGERHGVVGFVMWAVDDEDDSFCIGGLVIDAKRQRQGYGRATMEALIDLARSRGHALVGLSFHPSNPASALYRSLGFEETGETDGDEVIACLSLTP